MERKPVVEVPAVPGAEFTSGSPTRLGPMPARGSKHYPLAAFAPAFVAEFERYLRWLGDPGNGTGRVWQPSTITQQRRVLRLAASALAKGWGDVGRVTTLSVLVVPAHAQLIFAAYLDKGQPKAFVRTLATNLIALARHWVKLPEDELAQLLALRRRLGTTPSELTAKTRTLLRELANRQTLNALLALPATLADHARNARGSSTRRRRELRTAIAIELLLHTGMRLHQLATLRIGQHFSWPDDAQGALHIEAPGRRTRDGATLQYELTGAPQALLQEYIDAFAPKSTRQPRRWLFAARGGERVTDSALADGIEKATARGIGIRITPRDFRHICATLILDHHPGDYTTVKDLLGHQFFESTLAYYGDRERQVEATAWNEFLTRERAQLATQKASHAQEA